jgi:outer membrane protein assembly factor BamB
MQGGLHSFPEAGMNAILATLATLSLGAGDSPRYEIDPTGRLVRRDGEKVLWTARLDRGKDPRLLWDAKRVYVRHRDGLTALAAQSGVVLWHAKGPTDRLVLSRDLLLTTTDGWVTARAVTTGAEIFKERLPQGALAALFLGEDRVLLKGTEVARLPRAGKARWVAPLPKGYPLGNGGLVEVPGGDVVAFSYRSSFDSGVNVIRLDLATGEVVWRARCARLGVPHSRYWHQAAVAVAGDRLRVTSQGSSGTFVEELDLRTGKQLSRTRSKR